MTPPFPRCTRSTHMAVAAALSIALVGCVALLAPVAARAESKVDKVEGILRGAGSSGVVREPGSLDDAKKREVEALASALAGKTGGRVYVVILKSSSDPSDFTKTYERLGMAGKDVLIVSNGREWEFKCAGISAADKRRLMDVVMKSTGNPLDRMRKLTAAIPSALRSSQAKAGRAPASRSRAPATSAGTSTATTASQSEGGFPFGFAFLALLIVGGGGLVFWRRKQRDARLTTELKAALGPAENAMAEVFIGMDGIEAAPGFDGLLSRATALQSELDAIKSEAPSRQSITRAEGLGRRAKELESEMRALGGKGSAGLLGS